MKSIWTMGEMLVEIMRPHEGMPLDQEGEFLGPYPSGAPAIFIDTAARLGIPAGIIGGVGEDDFGRCLIDRLKTDGVNCVYVRTIPFKSTAVAFVTYFNDGGRKFIFHIDGTPAVMAGFPKEFGEGFNGEKQIREPGFFHVMGCSLMANENFREQILQAVQAFYLRGARISFDPNIRRELLGERRLEDIAGLVLDKCAVLFPGAAELELLNGTKDLSLGVKRLFAASEALELVVVKLGKRGCSIYSREQSIEVPAYPIQEVDPTGAGDCFDAGFLCGLLEGKSLEVCGRMACAAGALNASAFGPMEGKISREAVERMMRSEPQGFADAM